MYIFDLNHGKEERRYTGVNADITSEYVKISQPGKSMHCILYRPAGGNCSTAVIVIHSDSDYSTNSFGIALAQLGYITLCGQVSDPHGEFDNKLLNIDAAVQFLRTLPEVHSIVLFGHSGGATLMSAYQAIAENGPAIFQGSNMIYQCRLHQELHPADGLMFVDANWGNGAMTLLSIDPAVIDEKSGHPLNSDFDIFSAENGYQENGASYSQEFIHRYNYAQAVRNNELIDQLRARLKAIEEGNGSFAEDEPVFITGGEQIGPCNKLIPEDLHLSSHTRLPHILIHPDGSRTKEIVYSVRKSHFSSSLTPSIRGVYRGTIRDYLSNRAVKADPDNYLISEDNITGILWQNSYTCPAGNVSYVSKVPVLIMGMTGSYEYLAAETIAENIRSKDKELYFIEGASHIFVPCDVQYTGCDQAAYHQAADWLARHFEGKGETSWKL